MDIDFVVLWVDGNDPAWQAEKRRYEGKTDDSNGVHRFRDWGLMKYWFRAVEKFAPWVRTVHFVTWGHLPPFLDTSNPKLHIVRHEDYLPREVLPCFSANPLEMNLHRIEGLAEHFVYFNDDIFLTRPMQPDDFFDMKTGLPRAQFCELPCVFEGNLRNFSVYIARSVGLINKYFSKKQIPWSRYFSRYLNRAYPLADNCRTLLMRLLYPNYFTGLRVIHTYFCYRKSTFTTVWAKEPELLARTTEARFRSWDDVNQYFPYMWQLASGEFAPGRVSLFMGSIRDDTIDKLCGAIESQTYNSVCLNDSDPDIDFDVLSKRLDEAFHAIFQEKCSFEL